ncbi:MAG: glycosyltransferase family 39 protein [Ignavibacteria bacterium]|nr:glycosyltransferase family 39 protein [Ignavibacteria bacterium]
MRNDINISVTFAIFILASLLLLFNIQKGEIQPWDEGLYAYRARGILESGNWWDQTQISLGGLYSSTYPPLVPWAIALNIKLFGENLFSIRFFSVVCSVLLITLFFLFFSKIYDYQKTFLVALNLLLSYHWFFYSRQGMTDIPLIFFIFSTILASYFFLENRTSNRKIFWGFLVSISFALCLMTKIVISLIPILFLIYNFLRCRRRKEVVILTIFFLIGLFFALPWYLTMAFKYGSEFLSALFPPHLFYVVEGNTKSLGVFYYVNQLIIANPIAVLAFFSIFYRIKQIKFSKSFFSGILLVDFFIAWFILALLIFSLAPTKLPHYNLYILLPAMILSLHFLSFEYGKLSSNEKLLVFSFLLLSIAWYLSPQFRKSLSNFTFEVFPIFIFVALVLIFLLVIIEIFERKKEGKTFYLSLEVIVYFFSVYLVALNITFESHKPAGNVFGGKIIVDFLNSHNVDSFVYVFHKVNDSDTLNPQLAWHFRNKFFGQSKKKGKVYFLPLQDAQIGLEKLRALDSFPDKYIVYYVSSVRFPSTIILLEIAKSREIIKITPNYILFGRKTKKIHKDGNEVNV